MEGVAALAPMRSRGSHRGPPCAAPRADRGPQTGRAAFPTTAARATRHGAGPEEDGPHHAGSPLLALLATAWAARPGFLHLEPDRRRRRREVRKDLLSQLRHLAFLSGGAARAYASAAGCDSKFLAALQGMPFSERLRIVARAEEKEFLPGEVILEQGSGAENFYVVRRGTCSMVVAGQATPIGALPVGSYFGEIALLTRSEMPFGVLATPVAQAPRSARVVVLRWPRKDFEEVIMNARAPDDEEAERPWLPAARGVLLRNLATQYPEDFSQLPAAAGSLSPAGAGYARGMARVARGIRLLDLAAEAGGEQPFGRESRTSSVLQRLQKLPLEVRRELVAQGSEVTVEPGQEVLATGAGGMAEMKEQELLLVSSGVVVGPDGLWYGPGAHLWDEIDGQIVLMSGLRTAGPLDYAEPTTLLRLPPSALLVQGPLRRGGQEAAEKEQPEEEEAAEEVAEGQIWLYRGILAFVALLWGTNFGAVRFLEQMDLEPSGAAFARFVVAGVVMLPTLIYPRLVRPEVFLAGLECGLWISLGYFTQAIGLEGAQANTAAFICALTVVVVPFLEAVVFRKKLPAQVWAAAALALAGVAVIELGKGAEFTASDLWCLGQPFGFGVAFLRIEQYMEKYPRDALPLAGAQVLAVALMSSLWLLVDVVNASNMTAVEVPGLSDAGRNYVVLVDVKALPSASELLGNNQALLAIGYTGAVTTALAIFLETLALRFVPATEMSVIFSTEPLWAALFSAWLLGETMQPSAILGGGLVILACLVSQLGLPDWLALPPAAAAAADRGESHAVAPQASAAAAVAPAAEGEEQRTSFGKHG